MKFKIKNYLVSDAFEGIKIAKEILCKSVDKETALFLSGGKTPKDLYFELSKEKKLNPGGIAMVDERFGEKGHKNSNEKMIEETGFTSYLKAKNIPFYPILASDSRRCETRMETALAYEKVLKNLFARFLKRVAILGIGKDGHTAGMPAKKCHPELVSGSNHVANKMLNQVQHDKKEGLVLEYNDEGGVYGERITMTFNALSKMDLLIVLVFGEEKKKALEETFKKGSLEEIPARFYNQKEIAKKTLLITDLKI